MAKPKCIVYAVTRAIEKHAGVDEFFRPERIDGVPNGFTFNWRFAKKFVLPTLRRRKKFAEDLPIGYVIPLEDDDE